MALGVVLWGLHMGLTQGLLATLVADAAPAELRCTAYGMFNLMTGLALLAASVIAGALWDAMGPRGTFLTGAIFTVLAVIVLLMLRRSRNGGALGGLSDRLSRRHGAPCRRYRGHEPRGADCHDS